LSACADSSDAGRSPTPPPTASAVPSEMTAEGDLALNPPAPVNVRAARSGTTVKLVWDAPPPVRVPHSYSDRVVEYRVYRGDGGELRPIGTSPVPRFTDSTVGPGTYSYAVTSIREQNVEGTKSDPAVVITVS
ncbi:MAG: hypothetical protein QOF52_3361, partial [Propionibacteriaceae bacterium]|nr:hypothetical protein [Propionibacteriaceae bacterium]